MAYCLKCGAEIELFREKTGARVVCCDCGQDWTVVGRSPNLGIRFPSPEDKRPREEEDDEDEWEV